MEDARLPAHIEVSGLIRRIQAEGGFGTVLQKGERDAGTLVILTTHGGCGTRMWERMPQLDGTRKFLCTRSQDTENKIEFGEYLARRMTQDPDAWFVELDSPDSERFIDSPER